MGGRSAGKNQVWDPYRFKTIDLSMVFLDLTEGSMGRSPGLIQLELSLNEAEPKKKQC
jgi:hypothetical protein